jgi:thiamine biosynthesis lipoprotein
MKLHTANFHCMTTDIELYLRSDNPGQAAEALAAVQDFFYSVQSRFSRLSGDSELSRMNQASGTEVRVSPDLCELVDLAVSAAEYSGGLFDPAIVDALEVAGYDRGVEWSSQAGVPLPMSTGMARGVDAPWTGSPVRDARVDRQSLTVSLPRGIRFDLDAIAKGWAVDRAAAMLESLGPGLVNAGGDLRAWGDQPGAADERGWLASVDDPSRPGSDVAWLWVADCALATSSTTTRRWAGDHRVIDPRTGHPVETDLSSVTVCATTAVQAVVAARVVLLLGKMAGLAWLEEQPDLEALLVAEGGQAQGTPGLEVCRAWTPQVMAAV